MLPAGRGQVQQAAVAPVAQLQGGVLPQRLAHVPVVKQHLRWRRRICVISGGRQPQGAWTPLPKLPPLSVHPGRAKNLNRVLPVE